MTLRIISTIIFLTLISCNLSEKSNEKELNNSKDYIETLNQKESEQQNKEFNDLGNLISTVDFKLNANKEQISIFKDEIIPWISLENPKSEISQLIGAEEIVIKTSELNIIIDYPLNKPIIFVLKTNKNGFSRKDLITEISKKYNEIYNVEEKTAKIKTIPLKQRVGLINRNQTDGKYEIWGHDLQDLDLSSVQIYKTKDGKINITLDIES